MRVRFPLRSGGTLRRGSSTAVFVNFGCAIGITNCAFRFIIAPPPLGSLRFARGTARRRRSPRFARGIVYGFGSSHFVRGSEKRPHSVPPASRGNLTEGVINCCFCELWLGDWYQMNSVVFERVASPKKVATPPTSTPSISSSLWMPITSIDIWQATMRTPRSRAICAIASGCGTPC